MPLVGDCIFCRWSTICKRLVTIACELHGNYLYKVLEIKVVYFYLFWRKPSISPKYDIHSVQPYLEMRQVKNQSNCVHFEHNHDINNVSTPSTVFGSSVMCLGARDIQGVDSNVAFSVKYIFALFVSLPLL